MCLAPPPQEAPTTPLIRAYYMAWVFALLFLLNAVLAGILGFSTDFGRAERLAFGAISLAASVALGIVGTYLHRGLEETARH